MTEAEPTVREQIEQLCAALDAATAQLVTGASVIDALSAELAVYVEGCFRCDLNRDELGIAPEWPPRAISEWIRGGAVPTDALASELQAWAAAMGGDPPHPLATKGGRSYVANLLRLNPSRETLIALADALTDGRVKP